MLIPFTLFLFLGSTLALYPSKSSIVELTPSNFDNFVIRGDEIWIIEFFAPWCGHCQQLVPEYTKAANALKGVVKVGAVNADDHKELSGKYGVRGFPTIKIFGANKNKPEDYQGARTAEAIVNAGLNAAKSKVKAALGGGGSSGSSSGSSSDSNDDVIQLTDSNFDKLVMQSDDMWLIEFFAPWCGHCKNLAPHWSKAAKELKGKVKLGALDATVNKVKASQFEIQGYPTIKYFPSGRKSGGSSSAEEYDGGRTSTDIVQWALEKHADSIPAPEVTEIFSGDWFKSECGDKPLCVVAVLPHILDCQSKCRYDYIAILTELGNKYKKKMWSWMWAEAGAQPELENAIDIGGFGYPALAVINVKKMKYSIFRGSFSKEGINEFLRDLSYGKGNTAPVKGQELPKIYAIQPWNGEDAELPVEEEIDLSDVELDNKDEL